MSLPPLAFMQATPSEDASARSSEPSGAATTLPAPIPPASPLIRQGDGSGKDKQPPKKRNRLTLSCTHCRERKIKCSRSVPCDQCIKRGEAGSCHIEPFKHKAAQARIAREAVSDSYARDSSASVSPSQTRPAAPGSKAPMPTHAVPAASAGTGPGARGLAPASGHASLPLPSFQDSSLASSRPPTSNDENELATVKARLAHLENLLSSLAAGSQAPNASLAAATTANAASTETVPQSKPDSAPPERRGRSPDLFRRSQQSVPSQYDAPPPVGGVYNVSDLISLAATADKVDNVQRSRPGTSSPVSSTLPYQLFPRTSGDATGMSPTSSLPPQPAASDVPHAVLSPQPQSRTIPSTSASRTKAGVPIVTMPNGAVHLDIGTEAEDAAAVLEGLAMSGHKQARSKVSRSFGRMSVQTLMNKGNDSSASDPPPSAPLSPTATAQPSEQKRCPKPTCSSVCEGCETDDVEAGLEVPSTDILDPRRIYSFGPCIEAQKRERTVTSQSDGSAQSLSQPFDVPPSQGGDAEMHDSAMSSDGTDNDPNQPNGRICGSYTTPCKLACSNDGLFKLKQGPDTLLGWGLGWAFGAAESSKEFRTITDGFVCPGAPERESVLRAILRTLPPKDVTLQLVDVYRTRVYYLTGHVVHVPSLIGEIERFYEFSSVETQARALNRVDCGWLGLLLMVLVLGMQFYPCRPPEGYIDIRYLFDGRTIHLWYSAFKSVLILANHLSSGSVSVLQSILLAELYSAESDQTQSSLLHLAISQAQTMGLHRFGDQRRLPQPGEPRGTTILREIYRRIWWTLVWRDWCASERTGTYTIHMGQFNTPYPGNYNDLDLCQDVVPPPHPVDEHTEMSFNLSKLMIAAAVRETTDLLNQHDRDGTGHGCGRRLTCQDTRYLDASYRSILLSAPRFFRMGAEEGEGTDVEVQRWLLHQAVFSKLLRLHRVTLFSRVASRNSCVLLARSILDMQKKLREAQTIVDRLWFILLQSFNAAVVLMLDLLSAEPTTTDRLRGRAEVKEAVDSLEAVKHTAPYVSRSIRILEAMLEEEEVQFQRSSTQGSGKGQGNVLSLALRIKHAIEHNAPLQPAAKRDDVPGPSNQSSYAPDGLNPIMAGVLHGTSGVQASATPAGFPPAADFPYLLGPPGGVDPPPVAPNGTLLNGLPGAGFDFESFLASYQSSSSPQSQTQSHRSDTTSASSWSYSGVSTEEAKSLRDQPSNRMQVDPVPDPRSGTGAEVSSHAPAMSERTAADSFWAWLLSQAGGTSNASQPVSEAAPEPIPETAPENPQSVAPASTHEGQAPIEQESYWSSNAGAATWPGDLLPSLPVPAANEEADAKGRRLSTASVGSMGSMVSTFGSAFAPGSPVATPLPARRAETPVTPSRAAAGSVAGSSVDFLDSRHTAAGGNLGSPRVGSPGFESWFATSLEGFLQN